MAIKNIYIVIFILIVVSSCNKTAKSSQNINKAFGSPCNLKIEISGKAPSVQFTLFSKAKEKSISIDKQIDVLDEIKDEFSISTYLGGKIKCSLKTKDSFGPNVMIKVFVNGKFWQEVEGSYNPKIEGEIPLNF